MTKGFLFSLILHIAVVCLIIYGLPHMDRELPDHEVPFMMDVIAEETLTQKPAPPKMEVKPLPQPEPTPPKPEPKPEITPPEKQEEVVEEKEPEKIPEPELKPKIVEQPPKPEPIPEMKPEKAKVEEVPEKAIPVPRAKPSMKPKPEPAKKKEENRFSDILKDLKKMKEKTQVKGQEERDNQTQEEGEIGKQGDQISISEMDAVRAKISKCWNVLGGAKDAKDLKVKVHLWMNEDGTVNRAEVVKDIFAQNSPYYKIAADRALSAVLDKNCQPFPLSKKKFNLWKEFIFIFDPKEMLG